MKYLFNKIVWMLKQLLPFMYYSDCLIDSGDGRGDVRTVYIWRMWMGRQFNVKSWEIVK